MKNKLKILCGFPFSSHFNFVLSLLDHQTSSSMVSHAPHSEVLTAPSYALIGCLVNDVRHVFLCSHTGCLMNDVMSCISQIHSVWSATHILSVNIQAALYSIGN